MASSPFVGESDGTTAISEPAASIVIVEDYLLEYRRRFFDKLEAALAAESIRLTVAVGPVPTELAGRGDAVGPMSFVHEVRARSISVAGRRLTYKHLSDLTEGSDLVVVDQALRHLENYHLLLNQRHGRKVALWGHGRRRVKPASRLERRLEQRITKSAHWFFAYTQSGAAHIAASGFPQEQITVVQNTVDVDELAKRRGGVSVNEQLQLRRELDLPSRNVCLFIGGLDASKRIGFLLEASSIVARIVPDFVLIVAGDGDERRLVQESAASNPWLRYVGRVIGQQKARLGAVSDVLLMPGRVGLVAVDSFALRTPIITTAWPYHAPEVDYLEDGVNARFSADSVAEYARTVEQTLRDRKALSSLKRACAAAVPGYTLESMVERFAGGVISALATPQR